MQKKMPKISSSVRTPDGTGKVIALDFLKELVTVEFLKHGDEESTEIKTFNLSDISCLQANVCSRAEPVEKPRIGPARKMVFIFVPCFNFVLSYDF